MADNAQVSDNPMVAGDVIDGVFFQRTKPVWGVNGEWIDTSNDDPLPVSVKGFGSGIRVIGDNGLEADTIPVSGGASPYTPLATALVNSRGEPIGFSTPYVTSSLQWTGISTIYTTNTSLSSSLAQFTGVADAPLTGWISSMKVIDQSGTKPRLQFWFLDRSITSPSANASFDISDADLAYVVLVLDTNDGTWYDTASNSVCFIKPGMVRPYWVNNQANGLYCMAKVIGTPTLGSTTAILTRLHVLKD
jgi:hypothetical protein